MHSCFKRRQHHYFHSTHNFEFYSVRVSNITLWNDRHQFWNVIRSSSIWVWQYSINMFFFFFWNKWKFFVFDWMTGICFAESSLQKFSHLSIHFKRFLHALGKDKFLKYLIPFKVFFLDFMSFCAHICQLGLCKSQRLKRVFVAPVHFTRPTLFNSVTTTATSMCCCCQWSRHYYLTRYATTVAVAMLSKWLSKCACDFIALDTFLQCKKKNEETTWTD